MDEHLRLLERAVLESPGDAGAARAFVATVARHFDGASEPREAQLLGGRSVLGPLLPEERERLDLLEPGVVLLDGSGVGWTSAEHPRGSAYYEATLRLRVLELERIGRDAPAGFTTWFGINAAVDAGGEPALERLARVIALGPPRASERIAALLAARSEARVGRRLARLAHEAPADARRRLYDALGSGTVPLDAQARDGLRAAILRELPVLRTRAYEVLRRRASVEELRGDFRSGPPEVRASAFEGLAGRVGPTDAHELMRHALVDRDPEVRRSAIHLLSGSTWSRYARAAEWALGRLTDADRAVRTEAMRLLRRVQIPPRHVPRLRLIVEHAPPGIRPVLQRFLEQVNRTIR